MSLIFGPKSRALYAPPYGGELAQPLCRLSPVQYETSTKSQAQAERHSALRRGRVCPTLPGRNPAPSRAGQAQHLQSPARKERPKARLAESTAASFGQNVISSTPPAPSRAWNSGKSGKFFPTARKYFRKISNYFLPVGRNFAIVLDKLLILW
jgi:hypothetical protein